MTSTTFTINPSGGDIFISVSFAVLIVAFNMFSFGISNEYENTVNLTDKSILKMLFDLAHE